MNGRRSYSMAVRGAKAADNRRCIAEAARELFEAHSSGFTLDDVAARSGTSVQTVLRAFGSKPQPLVDTIASSRAGLGPDAFAGSLEGVVPQLFEDYERIGDGSSASWRRRTRLTGSPKWRQRGGAPIGRGSKRPSEPTCLADPGNDEPTCHGPFGGHRRVPLEAPATRCRAG
jgi:hypothetical protein